jgi:uncharacterized protein (DUF2141 family)
MKKNQQMIVAMAVVVILGALLVNACKPAAKQEEKSSATPANDSVPAAQPAEAKDTTAAAEPAKAEEGKTAEAKKGNVPLTVTVTNLENKKAPIHITFYQVKNKFLSLTDYFKDEVFVPHGSTLAVQITDLEYGEYAIAAYQDLDSDKKCNRNLIGIPTEPYAFSNNFKPTIRAPKFDECKFTYSAKTHALSFKMLWK